MEKKKSKLKGVLKYIVNTVSYTLLIILIAVGLALLFVFISAKVAKSQNAEPPVNLYTIISPSMTPNINVYDVVVTVKTDLSKLKVGDVISYYSDNPSVNGLTITHRIIEMQKNGDTYLFKTKGDANKYEDEWITAGNDVVGKVYFKVPQLGRVQFFLGSKGGWLLAILIPALGIIAYDIYKIIKLILIKQKIIAYQKNEGIGNDQGEIGTVTDVYKEAQPIDSVVNETPVAPEVAPTMNEPTSVETINNTVNEAPIAPIVDEPVINESPKEEIINIEDDKIISSFDEQIKAMDDWKSKIDEENR